MATKRELIGKLVAVAEGVIAGLEDSRLGLDTFEIIGAVALAGSILVRRSSDRSAAIKNLGGAVAVGVDILDDLEVTKSPLEQMLADLGITIEASDGSSLDEILNKLFADK